MFQAFGTSPVVIPGTLIATGAFPGSDQVDRISAEPADQVIDMKLATTLSPIKLHG